MKNSASNIQTKTVYRSFAEFDLEMVGIIQSLAAINIKESWVQ